MYFFFLALVFLFVGRKMGWFVSRAFLYTVSAPIAVVLCIAWGGGTAFLMRVLLDYGQPNVYMRWIMGYSLGAYVAVPNFGLIAEDTIPPEGQDRHSMISNVPLVVYIALSVALAFWMAK
jgi:hypothetical protein